MHYLVTGGAGYLGSVLVEELLLLGHSVSVVDSLYYRQNSLLPFFKNKKLTLHVRDACDNSFIAEELKKADVIIPLAALVGAKICDEYPKMALDLNFHAIEFLVKNKSKSQAMIYPCTNSGYGVGEKDIYCTEETPLRPVSLYGKTKVNAEEILLGNRAGASLRFATLFGISARMRLDLLVNDFVYRALRDKSIVLFEGHFKRNYLHVRDAARALLFAVERYDQTCGSAFNVGMSDANLSKLELCKYIQKFIPFEIIQHETAKDPDQRNYIISNEKIEKLGFRTNYTLEDGMLEIQRAYPYLRTVGFVNA